MSKVNKHFGIDDLAALKKHDESLHAVKCGTCGLFAKDSILPL